MNLFDLSGKTAVVIGGNGVLGSAMAQGLANHGAAVAVAGRNQETARQVAAAIAEDGPSAKAFQVDATKKADLSQLLEDVLAWNGSIDIVVNCPGTNSATPFFEVTEEEWDKIMDVNLKSVMLSGQVFGEYLTKRAQGGSIINISSVSSDPPLSRVFTYSASKAGVNNVTQFLAREFAPYGVRVNAIIPGFFPAEQNRAILKPERVTSIMGHTPMNRFGEPHELQGAVVWLASDQASGFVTGSLIRVDGGFGAMTI
ncbi:SDR family NAD(P)-dependent oxidoreductase [Xylanibacillus composti]|uniref:D-mannonate oxidoreductase n=1 Tax=Xylanibacillus composti TaxID=1572762 RepID=A0A8J4M1G3_9BACL|nr:SDR family oxidoreductase [Xylanibacillus composti]MDT9726021.1 SDR family NAD(P)-dependent oxidoreductase [Xylanibacillus composti]GIQ68835.1 D-mannonate oxidoreductase [Xylanibacillus composti]